jgi:hypothetical protein
MYSGWRKLGGRFVRLRSHEPLRERLFTLRSRRARNNWSRGRIPIRRLIDDAYLYGHPGRDISLSSWGSVAVGVCPSPACADAREANL